MMLLAFAEKAVNQAAVDLSPTMGWLLLGCALCVALIFILHADRWRRWWLTAEDPRGIAVFRIVFSFFVICNINDMWEFFEFLYTDEGIFTADVARQVFARHQFAGFGDGFIESEPWGFFDPAAVWQFLKGPKWSLLYFWDSPTFFWAHWAAFHIAAICLMVGFRTRVAGVLTWFLMNSILVRNHLAWEGTELVYRCMLVYLVLARSGHAYSVDNWLRCRKLRKAGTLSERGGPGEGAGAAPTEEHPKGLAPIYRLIPSWPRKLIMLQLATIYITTGTLKTGSVWMRGDSLYYALNLDHFYRLPPQYLSSVIGTSVFRGMTYAVKIGQTAFPLVVVGLIARFAIKQKLAPLSGARQWGARAAFAGLIGLSAAMIAVAWPVHFTPKISAAAFVAIWVGVWGAIWALWWRLGTKPFVVRGRTLDRDWMCRWIIGRRVLLVWHVAFHAHIFTLMNVGQFQTAMLACTFAFLEGREIATLLRDIGYRMSRLSPRVLGRLFPRSVVERAPIVQAEDPALPSARRDASVLPDWVLGFALLGFLGGILVRVQVEPQWDFRLVWVATAAVVGGFAWHHARQRRGKTTGDDPTVRAPWAYGPLGRLIIGGLVVWHISAVTTWLMPDKQCMSSFRKPSREVFSNWLRRTTTDQGWGMFAPNPPRSNVFLKVLVTDKDGEVWDLRTDVYAEEQKPIPWIWNTRLRKMNRRIIGGESGPSQWYRKWYARYECRAWARTHGGEAPKKVELVKVWYKIPKPEDVSAKGYYVAEELLERTGHESVEYTAHCARDVMGQLPNFIRQRDGLPLVEDGTYKPWIKQRRSSWERREELEANKKKKKRAKK